jgi:hypothetical protein
MSNMIEEIKNIEEIKKTMKKQNFDLYKIKLRNRMLKNAYNKNAMNNLETSLNLMKETLKFQKNIKLYDKHIKLIIDKVKKMVLDLKKKAKNISNNCELIDKKNLELEKNKQLIDDIITKLIKHYR